MLEWCVADTRCSLGVVIEWPPRGSFECDFCLFCVFVVFFFVIPFFFWVSTRMNKLINDFSPNGSSVQPPQRHLSPASCLNSQIWDISQSIRRSTQFIISFLIITHWKVILHSNSEAISSTWHQWIAFWSDDHCTHKWNADYKSILSIIIIN